jgi:hypothetical protein
MNNFINECKQQIARHHARLQKRIIPRYTAAYSADISECEKGINPLNKNKLYLYWIIKAKKIRDFLKKIKQYLKVETTHAIYGPAPKNVTHDRISKCLACPGRVKELEGKIDPGGIGFCSLCGCGANRRAALSVKLTLAGATCPLNQFQPVTGKEKTKWVNIKDAVKGVLYSIIDRIKI